MPLRILVLDDDELQIELVQRFFAYEGFSVQVSRGASELPGEVGAFAPHFVLLDVNIPGLGRAALTDVVGSVRVPGAHAQVLLFSAEDETRLRALAVTTKADGYLSKGTSLPVLAAKLRSLAGRPAHGGGSA
ncbi:MAG: baeR1 [Labilithrix sp.]|nr:baeR1 [Labilithrix sp.]